MSKDNIVALEALIEQTLFHKTDIKVLEAGCGFSVNIRYPSNAHIVGIDVSQKQLMRNNYAHEKILGDIQYYELKQSSFDVIVCWDVLEHLAQPELALSQFANAIKKDGLVILALPNVISLKGLVTKYTPHWFHALIYRYVYDKRNKSRETSGPFRTYLKFILAPDSLKEFFKSRSMNIVYFHTRDVFDLLQKRNKLVSIIYRWVNAILKFLSFGKLGDSDFILVLKK